jgi:hypothetical protein
MDYRPGDVAQTSGIYLVMHDVITGSRMRSRWFETTPFHRALTAAMAFGFGSSAKQRI